MYTPTHTYIYTDIHTYIYTYIYVYTHIHISYIYTHRHTHIHLLLLVPPLSALRSIQVATFHGTLDLHITHTYRQIILYHTHTYREVLRVSVVNIKKGTKGLTETEVLAQVSSLPVAPSLTVSRISVALRFACKAPPILLKMVLATAPVARTWASVLRLDLDWIVRFLPFAACKDYSLDEWFLQFQAQPRAYRDATS